MPAQPFRCVGNNRVDCRSEHTPLPTLPLKGGGDEPRPVAPPGPNRAEPSHEVHVVLAERAPHHRRAARHARRQAHHGWARGRERSRTRRRSLRLHHRARDRGEAASERRPAARLHRRYRRGRANPGRVRRAECAHRHEGRVLPARHLHSGQEDHARRRHHPRRREPRHAGLGSRDGIVRRPRGHHRPAGRRAGRRELRQVGAARRSGDRDQPHAQPPGLHRRARHRARSCGRRHGQVHRSVAEAREGRIPLPGRGEDRRARSSAPALRCASCAA